MDTLYYIGEYSYMKDWCKRKYGPKEPYRQVRFDVIDSQDESVKLTGFTLKMNGWETEYQLDANNDVLLSVLSVSQFTIQITDVSGYVDGVANTYTADILNGSHIGLTKKKEYSDTAEFKLDWNLSVSDDLDSHMVIKSDGVEIGHVSYSQTQFQDATTSVTLDIDNVSREDQKPPEIISINKINPNYTYYYYVHDFSESQQLPKTNLNLNVVLSNETVDPAITIPTEDNPYSYWNVCKIQNGDLKRASEAMISTITQEPNTDY